MTSVDAEIHILKKVKMVLWNTVMKFGIRIDTDKI